LPPTSTNAVGTLVDDPSGTPLSNEKVQLDPWIVYATPGPTPAPIFTTTTDATGHFTVNAANGTYLLVIGSDDPTDTTRPTIHDKVVLSGQAVLTAPTMPPVPGITPAPVEANGDYRLVTIDKTHEIPCITDYDQQRTSRGLPKPVIDEWLTENVRAWVNQSVTTYNGKTDASNPFGFLTTGNVAETGGSGCSMAARWLLRPSRALPAIIRQPHRGMQDLTYHTSADRRTPHTGRANFQRTRVCSRIRTLSLGHK